MRCHKGNIKLGILNTLYLASSINILKQARLLQLIAVKAKSSEQQNGRVYRLSFLFVILHNLL